MSSPTLTTVDTKIHTRAILVWLNLRSWSGHKFDKSITQTINSQLHTSADAGRYNKHLLKDSKNLRALQTLIGKVRIEHYTNTLAWSDEGWRLLTNDNYMQYAAWVRDRQADIDRAADALVQGWDSDVQADRARLNGTFDYGDYPDRYDVRSKFGLSLSYMPLAMEGDVRINLAADQVAMIESEVQRKLQESIAVAVADSWSRLADVVTRISERLSDVDHVFRDSLINNARETCSALSRLNVTNDPELDRMRARVESELTKYDAQALRDFPNYRKQTADRAAAILADMKRNGVI